jgi:uncharacterized protein YndB with AHSA1/START domain
MQDVITKEITVKASAERVYSAITDPRQIITWFPDAVEGTLEVGQRPIFTFEGHGKSALYIEAAQPFEYFAYRWIPGGTAAFVEDVLTVPNTLVEFRIEALSDGTKVTLKESGFAALPAEVAEKSLNENSGGWEYMINRLEKVLSPA